MSEPFVPTPSPEVAVSPLVKRLLAAPSLDDPDVQSVYAELTEAAEKRGWYAMALIVKSRLNTVPWIDAEGAPIHKERGYDLAGAFILRHISAELDAVAAGACRVGPKIFSGYCGEMAACFLEAGNVRRCVEEALVVLSRLMRDFVASLGDYRELALALIAAVSNQLKSHTDRAARAARATPPPGSEDETAGSGARKTLTDMDVRYAAHFQKAAEAFQNAIADVPPFDAASIRDMDWLHGALRAANAAQCRPFAAVVKTRIAALLAKARHAKAGEFYAGAAADYAAQERREADLNLPKLAAICKRRAQKCREAAGSAPSSGQATS